MYLYIYIYLYLYLYIDIYLSIYLCNHENNVLSRLLWLCGNSCTWAHDVRSDKRDHLRYILNKKNTFLEDYVKQPKYL